MSPLDLTALLSYLDGDSIGEALLAMSGLLCDRPEAVEVGTQLLDEIALTVDGNDVAALVAAVFGAHGFRGDVLNYHAEENSLLDRVLERRSGMPITLSAVAIEVGRRCGMELEMIGMPGHVIVGTGTTDSFIDAYGGVEVDLGGLQRRFESIFGETASFSLNRLRQLDAVGAVNRVGNNLLRTWAKDRSSKVDRLLEMRAMIPASDADRQLVLGVAEARRRFDIAARLREQLDPDDPKIDQLWAQLN